MYEFWIIITLIMQESKKSGIEITSINPNKEQLTVEKLKTFSGCENYSDEEATEIVLSIQILCKILFENFNQNISSNNNLKKAA